MVGDSAPAEKPLVSFTCGNCGSAVTIHAAGFTVSAACSSCGSISDSEDGVFKLVRKASEAIKLHPNIQLGTKGKLRGQVYQVIGFMRRHDRQYPNQPWQEYLLYNPYTGYRWLAEYNGHWTLYKVTKHTPKPKPLAHQYEFLGKTYRMFQSGNAVVDFVLGEFYWKVRVGSASSTMDLVHPPYILSRENDQSETVWSFGEYIQPKEIADAFHLKTMPQQFGIAPNQPRAHEGEGTLWAVWFAAFLFILIFQVFGTSLKREVPKYGQQVDVPAAGVVDVEVGSFNVRGFSSHVTIYVETNIQQSWANIDLRVVSEDPSQPVIPSLDADISFYSGYESDGSWSEGSTSKEFLVNALPRGNYRVLMSATPEPGHSFAAFVKISPSSAVYSNFWLALFLISLPPVWITFRSHSFEKQRWSESDYSPYFSGES